MPTNKIANDARKNKMDEFYILRDSVEAELKHYDADFNNKVVYCNCDNCYQSEFVKYFIRNFARLHLKQLISTCYVSDDNKNQRAYKFSMTTPIDSEDVDEICKVDGNSLTHLKGNGDFRSEECIQLMRESDIIVTGPPFSLLRQLFQALFDNHKQFLVVGTLNFISKAPLFEHIRNNEVWLGHTCHAGDVKFRIPSHYELIGGNAYKDSEDVKYAKVTGIRWFTNLGKDTHYVGKAKLNMTYSKYFHHKADNVDILCINKSKEIPKNYKDLMAVPVSFFDKICGMKQYRIIASTDMRTDKVYKELFGTSYALRQNNKEVYSRLIIQKI